ncbi:MAG: sigma-70 family RNA polymerase sigma factor [Burkholderiaceae bacterium]|nr:sigma-70 family RNA polymerase sigma factor [Aquabacterium sp.]NUP84481.1 sigma-70 family RNA polymerase sigma factor [Burkholderiaceae bacterium]
MNDFHGTLPPSSAVAGPRGVADTTASLEAHLPSLRTRLLRHARFALHDEGLAEDLVQDTLMAVVEQHETRRGDSALTTWAIAILKNKVADWYRSPTRKRFVTVNAEHESSDEAIDALYTADGAYVEQIPAWQQPDNRTEQRQMMTVLERCVGCLPRQTGRVFMMREWLGFETTEICARLGISAENCRAILHRARMSLRACMQRDWIETRARA